MQQLKLEELMRYVLAGGVGIVALTLGFCDVPKSVVAIPGVTQASLLLFLALVLGSVVYTVHRALLYPMLYRLILLVLVVSKVYAFDARLLWPFVPARLEVSLDFLRWHRAKDHYAQSRLAEWAAQVHFLFCSGWAILLISWLGCALGLRATAARPVLFCMAIAAILVAFLSNCRLLYFDSRLALREAPQLGSR